MKACNFASMDPGIAQKGLGNVSSSDSELWQEFVSDSSRVSLQAEEAFEQVGKTVPEENEVWQPPGGPSEVERTVKVRRVQKFFRNSVLVGYDSKCALSGIALPELIIASHIIPWSESVERRADPTNGIALNALYDRVFDKGFITFSDDYKVLVSKELKDEVKSLSNQQILDIDGTKLNLPSRFQPDRAALEWHRENLFKG